MQGYVALWLPGTDHASIATEAKIVEGYSKGRNNQRKLAERNSLRRLGNGRKIYGGRIIEQLKETWELPVTGTEKDLQWMKDFRSS